MVETASTLAGVGGLRSQSIETAAFEELYRTYLQKVFNYVYYRVANVATAEDITAEVFERALGRLGTFNSDRGAFSTWLFTIAHNVTANFLRDNSRRPPTASVESMAPIAVADCSPEEAAVKAEEMHRLWRNLGYLSDQQREVLALKFGSELSNQQIAQAMHLSSSNVAVVAHRAVRTLRQLMEAEEALK